ncbi:hypothetical protein BH09MYX1_BH09MYX1_34110 [soil metagenome]
MRVQAFSLLAALAVACGGIGPFDGSVYREGKIAFHAGPIDPGWRRLEASQGAIAFRDDAHGASIMVHARCDVPGDDAPLLALTNHLVIGTTERDVKKEETLPFDGREARHTVLTAKLDGVAQTFDLWVMKKDGCVYDLVYIAAPERYEGGEPAYARFVEGFRTLAVNP